MFAPERLNSINTDATTPTRRQISAGAARLAAADLRPDFSRIGLIGFGAFGQLIARYAPADVSLLAYDVSASADHGRANRASLATRAKLTTLADVAACPVVVIAAPVSETAQICRQIAPWLRPGALVVDVGSVKLQPVADMLAGLPAHVEIAGLHPLFGPQSAAAGIAGQRLVVCPVRGRKVFRLAAMLRRWFGVEVQFASPEAHDREMALVQGLTHMVARLVASLDAGGAARPTRMATQSHALLMQAVNMVRHDNPAVFDAIALRNPFVAAVQEQFFDAADALRQDLHARRRAQESWPAIA